MAFDMLITFTGDNSDFFMDAFFNVGGAPSVAALSAGSTFLSLYNTSSGILTTLNGYGFASDGQNLFGTLTSITFSNDASFSDFDWGLNSFLTAVDFIWMYDSYMPLSSLFSSQDMTLDASGASAGLDMDDWRPLTITSDTFITGSRFVDRLQGFYGADTIMGGVGDDSLYGAQNADCLYGGGGDDLLLGGSGDDLLFAGAGADEVYGGWGDDTIELNGGHAQGGVGNDLIILTMPEEPIEAAAPEDGFWF
jgi:Ca2+-binding RTX toxin-like protein